MPNTVTLEHAKAHLEDLMAGAEHHEEWVVINANGKPMGKLAAYPVGDKENPAPNTGHSALLGLMAGQIKLLPGWDEPLEEFDAYRG